MPQPSANKEDSTECHPWSAEQKRQFFSDMQWFKSNPNTTVQESSEDFHEFIPPQEEQIPHVADFSLLVNQYWDSAYGLADPSIAIEVPTNDSPTQYLLSEDHYQFKIRDEQSFIKAKEFYKSGTEKPTDFPKHLDGFKGQYYYIRLLFNAIKNTEGIIDGEKFLASFGSMFDDNAIEIACWEILLAARDVQRWGKLTAAHHKHKLREFPSFESRMMAIVETCRKSKAVCKGLMEPSRIFRTAQDPNAEIKGKLANSELNKRKSGAHKIGQEIIKAEGRIFDQHTSQWLEPNRGLRDIQEEMTVLKPEDYTPGTGMSFPLEAMTLKRRQRDSDVGFQDAKRVKQVEVPYQSHLGPRQIAPVRSARPFKDVARTSAVSPGERNIDSHDSVDPEPQQVYNNFRKRLCRLLGVDFDAGTCPPLHELRLYAYAVNDDLTGPGGQDWHHNLLPNQCHGSAFSVMNSAGELIYEHFAKIAGFDDLLTLAINRKDLNASGDWEPFIFQQYINTTREHADQMACGLVPNLFGVLDPQHMEVKCVPCLQPDDQACYIDLIRTN